MIESKNKFVSDEVKECLFNSKFPVMISLSLKERRGNNKTNLYVRLIFNLLY